MEWAPTANADVLRVALPLLSEPVPIVVPPSLNVIVPVAAVGVTVAVNVTAMPDIDGFAEDANATEDACFTVCVSVVEVLVLSFVSPP
jgi:hypothetical protein